MDVDQQSHELIEQFQVITGCTVPSEAQHYVEACGNDLTKALNLYFAQQSRGNAQESSQPQEPRQCANGGSSSSRPSTSGRGSTSADPDEVRAPIAPVRGPIVEQSFQQSYRNRNRLPRDNVFDRFGSDFRVEAELQLRDMQRRMRQYGIGNGSANDDEEEDSESSRETAEGRRREKERSLRDIFQPPFDMMFKGGWEAARMDAERDCRWLLVNIQDPSEFASQVLNRDVWSNSAVKDVVMNNFVFWQVFHESADGNRIGSYYKISDYPAIFIVDPRTGELVKRMRSTDTDAVSICDDLTTFLEKFPDYESHDKQQFGYGPPVPAPVPKTSVSNGTTTEKPNGGAEADSSARKSRKRQLSVENTYDDQPGPSTRIKKPKQNVEKEVEEITDLIKNGHKLTEDKEWKSFVPPPTADSIEVAVVLRMPNGERKNIAVPDSTTLKALFAFINEQGYAMNDHILVLSYPKREYSTTDSGLTLQELKFSHRELIHVEKKYY